MRAPQELRTRGGNVDFELLIYGFAIVGAYVCGTILLKGLAGLDLSTSSIQTK